MAAQGQLTKQEASSLLLLAHEQTLMEIGAIAGEKFAGLPSCGRGPQAREHASRACGTRPCAILNRGRWWPTPWR